MGQDDKTSWAVRSGDEEIWTVKEGELVKVGTVKDGVVLICELLTREGPTFFGLWVFICFYLFIFCEYKIKFVK